MAGTRVAYPSVNDSSYGNAPMRNKSMDEDDIIALLRDPRGRHGALEQLRAVARRNGGHLPFRNPRAIFQSLALILSDANWESRQNCLYVVNELIPKCDQDVDDCMSVILPELIQCIGDIVTVRRAVLQTLHVYMKHTSNMQYLCQTIVRYGLENRDRQIKRECILGLPIIFTPDVSQEDFSTLMKGLVRVSADVGAADPALQQEVLLTLQKMRGCVGDDMFDKYIQKLPGQLKKGYLEQVGADDKKRQKSNSKAAESSSRNGHVSRYEAFTDRIPSPKDHSQQYRHPNTRPELEFGVVPSHIMDKLNDQNNFRTRAQAVEELKALIRDLDDTGPIHPHLVNFISFLNTLLDDSNFKISTVTLEIFGFLVEKLGVDVRPHMKNLISALTKRMPDNKIVIRQAIMKVAMQLMQILKPRSVVYTMCDNLHHRNSRVRQETINIIIASLLTFPSYEFDLGELCNKMGPTLIDPKRQVRQAALECFAAIQQAMGSGKSQALVRAVDSVELNTEGDGVLVAVQARISRRQLPKLNADRLVEYATPLPSSAGTRASTNGQTVAQGPDIEWILRGSGSSGSSARSTRSDYMELESVSSSARSTPSNLILDSPSHGPSPRRHVTSGKKNRLPWEEDMANGDYKSGKEGSVSNRSRISQDNDENKIYRTPRRAISQSGNDDSPPEQGSYQQIQMNKYRRQMSDGSNSLPFSVYNANKEPEAEYIDGYLADWDTSGDDQRGKGVDLSPVPTRPMVYGRNGSSSKKKVPPIQSDKGQWDDYPDSYRDDVPDDDMANSLRQIRNSATKKKAEKIFSQSSSRESSPPSFEDTMRSDMSYGYHEPMDSTTPPKKKGKKTESPFESKPKLVRKSSVQSSKTDVSQDSGRYSNSTASPNDKAQIDFNPLGGVTFRENRNPDVHVQIVGKGYAEDAHPVEPKPSLHATKAKDRRKAPKGVLSPLGMASTLSHGQMELDDDKVPGGVVGKSIHSNGSDYSSERALNRRTSRSDLMPGQYGVYGHGVRGSSGEDEQEEEDVQELQMSKTTRENLAARQRAKQEEADQKRVERERERERVRQRRVQEVEEKRREREEEQLREKERQQDKLRHLSGSLEPAVDALTISSASSATGSAGSSPSSGSKPRNVKSVTKKNKQPSEVGAHPLSAKSGEPEPTESLKPFKEPSTAYTDAMKKVASEEWDAKCVGLCGIRRLIIHHPDVILPHLHNVVIAVMAEVKNLRSQVSRHAVLTFNDMYTSLRRHMDADLDQVTKVLLHKSNESNGFIRADIERTLLSLVENVTPQRAAIALIVGGASHKTDHVRKISGQFLVEVVERMGPGRVLSGIKDVTDRILPTAASFLVDKNPDVRYTGQRMLHMLMSHDEFEKCMNKYVSAATLKNIQDKLENLRRNGPSDPPHETASARARRSEHASRSNSMTRGNSAQSEINNSASTKRKSAQVRTDDSTMEDINRMMGMMAASDWRERQRGIMALKNMAETNIVILRPNFHKISDKFVPCLRDSNSKVNHLALQIMADITSDVADYMHNTMNHTIQTVAANLSSKNEEIHGAACSCLDEFMEHVDPSILLTPFVQQAQNGTPRVKPDMVDRVSFLVTKVYPKKPKQVVLHVLPLLWHLMGATPSSGAPGGSNTLRTSTENLIHTVYSQMGMALLDHASQNSKVNPRMLQTLQDIVQT